MIVSLSFSCRGGGGWQRALVATRHDVRSFTPSSIRRPLVRFGHDDADLAVDAALCRVAWSALRALRSQSQGSGGSASRITTR
jgi:hypothetical protein